jgi:ataxin-3
MLFSFIAEPTSSSTQALENSLATLKGASQQPKAPDQSTYEEDEDYELQQALQASLQRHPDHDSDIDVLDATISPDPSTPTGEVDPVAASLERNRLVLQRMREQQELAQRELWSDAARSPEDQAVLEDRRAARRQQEEEEERELRMAIEESETLARQHAERMGHSEPAWSLDQELPARQTPPTPGLTDPDSDSEDEEMAESVTHEEPVQTEPTVEELRQARLARFA